MQARARARADLGCTAIFSSSRGCRLRDLRRTTVRPIPFPRAERPLKACRQYHAGRASAVGGPPSLLGTRLRPRRTVQRLGASGSARHGGSNSRPV